MRRVEHEGVEYGVGVHERLGRVLRDPAVQVEGGRPVRLALLDRRAAVVWAPEKIGELSDPPERERELVLWAREYLLLLESGRKARCRGCGVTLRQLRDARCPGCGWMRCACGSCGCDGVFRRRRKLFIGR